MFIKGLPSSAGDLGDAAIGGSITSGTAGSVLFVGTGPVLAQDNANFFWDDTNNRLGLGTNAPTASLHIVQAAQTTTAAPIALLVVGGAHTNLTLSTEDIGINLNMSATKQWAAGNITTQREFLYQTPTYAIATLGATIATGVGFVIDKAPTAGTNVTFTNLFAAQMGGAVTAGPTTAAMIYRVLDVPAHTVTVSGTTGVTSVGFAGIGIGQITVSDFSAMTMDTAAALYISASPVQASSAVITHAIGAWIGNTALSPATAINKSDVYISSSFTPSASSPNYAGLHVNPTINGTSSGKAAGLAIATKTNTLTGGTINLIDAGTTTTSYFTGYTQVFSVSTVGVALLTGGSSGYVSPAATGFYLGTGTGSSAVWQVNAGANFVNYLAGTGSVGSGAGRQGHYMSTTANPAASKGALWIDGYNSVNQNAAITTGQIFRASTNGTELFAVGWDASTAISQQVNTSGVPTALTVTSAAHTSMTTLTEDIGINFNLSATKQWATGAITTQREFLIQAPTYAFVGASIITTAVTLDVAGAPIAGTNATLTSSYAIRGGGIIAGATTSGPAFLSIQGASSSNGGVHLQNAGTTLGKLHHSASSDITLLGLSGTAIFIQGNKNASSTVANCIVYVATAAGAALASGICFDVQNAGTTTFKVKWDGGTVITQAVNTANSPVLLTLTGAAHTTLAASTEASDVLWSLNRTVQFATGALTTQRAVQILAPTYAFAGASTLTNAATLYIDGAPAAGTNATITNKYSLWIDAGLPRLDSTTANGTTATVLGSVGPSGANTTVQEWLTVDINGTTRYLPCF